MIAVIGTVLFGTLHVRPGPDAVAAAFSHSSQLALLVNVAILGLALILVLGLPWRIRVGRRETAANVQPKKGGGSGRKAGRGARLG